jgi:hypothetical protein
VSFNNHGGAKAKALDFLRAFSFEVEGEGN